MTVQRHCLCSAWNTVMLGGDVMLSSVMQMTEDPEDAANKPPVRTAPRIGCFQGINRSTSCMWRTKYYFMLLHCHVLLCFVLYSIMCSTWSTASILSLLNLCLNYQPPRSLNIKRVLRIWLTSSDTFDHDIITYTSGFCIF